MGDFRKLRVWRAAHELFLEAHRVAMKLRGAHNMSLRSQIIRAALSIPTNIVEGRAQQSDAAFKRYPGYSMASTREVQYEMLAGRDTGAISDADYGSVEEKAIEVLKMLSGLIARLDVGDASEPDTESESTSPPAPPHQQ